MIDWLPGYTRKCDEMITAGIELIAEMDKEQIHEFALGLQVVMDDESTPEKEQDIAMFALIGFLELVRKAEFLKRKEGDRDD